MMRARGFTRSKTPDDGIDELESLASPSKDDRMSDRGDDEGNWGFQLTLIFVLCLLLGVTQYLLRCDNLQLKAAAKVIRNLQAKEAEAWTLIPPQPKADGGPECDKQLALVKGKLAELRAITYSSEKKMNELNNGCSKTMQLLSDMTAEKERMETQIQDLDKEKKSLAAKLGILSDGTAV